MKKNVLVFGLTAGLILAIVMVATFNFWYKDNDAHSKYGMWIGYGSMIVAFSFIFVGIKNYRDQFNNGLISFSKAFQIGLYIALIGCTIYVLSWLVEYYIFMPDFMDKYAAHVLAEAKSHGATPAELKQQQAQMASYQFMYKNPLMVIVLTYVEILPVGLIIALIAALILKRKTNRPITVAA